MTGNNFAKCPTSRQMSKKKKKKSRKTNKQQQTPSIKIKHNTKG